MGKLIKLFIFCSIRGEKNVNLKVFNFCCVFYDNVICLDIREKINEIVINKNGLLNLM